MSRLSESALHLAKRMESRNGEAITYTRGEDTYTTWTDPDTEEEKPLLACKARTRAERIAMLDGRANFDVEPADWIVRGVAFAGIGLEVGEPLDGDRITTAEGEVWELAGRDNEPCYRKSDQWGHALRLRCIRVDDNIGSSE